MTDISEGALKAQEDEWVRSMKEVIANSIEIYGTRCGACDSKYECNCDQKTCLVCFNQECSCKPAAAMEYQLTRTSCL